MKKCSAWAGTASAAARSTVGFHMVTVCVLRERIVRVRRGVDR